MSANHIHSVLAVGVATLPTSTRKLEIHATTSAREAFSMLRLLHFDLLLVGCETCDESVWWLIQRVLLAWPQQRWALVARDVTFEEEIRARSLGSSLIMDRVPDGAALHEIVGSLLGRKLSDAASWPATLPSATGREAEVNSVTTSTS